mgnify:FL=1
MEKETMQVIGKMDFYGIELDIYGSIEDPWFKADDISKCIEHSNTSKMMNMVNEKEQKTIVISTLTNGYSALKVSEFGLYSLLFKSRLPKAEEFNQKVMSTLKQIRLRGGYIVDHDKYISTATQEEIDELTHRLKLEDHINRSLIRQLKNKQQDLHKAWEVQNRRGEVIKLYNELLDHLDQNLLTREEIKIIGRIEMTKELYNM